MPVSRLTRDDILHQALNMADLPELDKHDRPAGTIVTTALSVDWFQRMLDAMHQEFPWAGDITSVTGTITLLNTTNLAPADFILDVRDGLLLDVQGSTKSMIRRNFSDIMNFQAKNNLGGSPVSSQPALYCFTGRTLRLDITPDTGYPYRLWYYAMPVVAAATDIPNFPAENALIDYVYLRALEWGRKVPQGSAMKYLREVEIPAVRSSNLGQEPESDHIPLDRQQFRGARRRPWDWMGTTRPNF